MLKKKSLKVRMIVSNCVPLILFVILLAATCYSINSLLGTSRWVDHTYRVIQEALVIEKLAVDMETGERGYLLAGKEEFLSPYANGEKMIFEKFDALKKRVDDNPKQVRRLEEAESVLKEWQTDVVNEAVALRKEIGHGKTMNDMAKLVGQAKGKEYFDRLRSEIHTFISREEKFIKARKHETEQVFAQMGKNMTQLIGTADRVEHTIKVLAEANQVLAHATDMETGMRGFLITEDEVFLAPYHGGSQLFGERITGLATLVRDNPPQVERIRKAQQIIEHWQETVVRPAISLHRQVRKGDRRSGDISAFVSQKTGKQLFDNFRKEMDAFRTVENSLIRERNQAAEEIRSVTIKHVGTMREFGERTEHTHIVIQKAMKAFVSAIDTETGMRGYLLSGIEDFLEPYHDGKEKFAALLAELTELVRDNPEQVMLLEKIGTTFDTWLTEVTEPRISIRKKIGHAKTMDDMANFIGKGEGKQYFDRFRSKMATITAEEKKLMAVRQQENMRMANNTMTLILLGTLAALIVSFAMTWKLSGYIAGIIGRMIEKLTDSANQVTAASGQLSSASRYLAQGASEQAGAIEESSASLEEMATMTRQNAGNAGHAKNIVGEFNEIFENVDKYMALLTTAFQEISTSGEKTFRIIKTIDEIAFQTNLLALNASVEAARAGNAGAGFALVADQVRTLALRSAAEARNTSELIEMVVKKIREGRDIVGSANDAFAEASGYSARIGELVSDITAASDEQAQGIGQISQAVASMDQVTQQNVASAEKTSAATEQLLGQSGQMEAIVKEMVGMIRGTHNNSRLSPGRNGTGNSDPGHPLYDKVLRPETAFQKTLPHEVLPLHPAKNLRH